LEPKKKINPLKAVSGAFIPRNMRAYSPNIPIYLEKKNFIIKTADNRQELYEALKLRHDIFIEELLHKRKKSGLDIDIFDRRCDHLMIIDKRNNQLIGTYRLQSSQHTRKWYTATEFHMKQIHKLPGNKLELGRACVHPDYRNGVTIALLWEGIHAYIMASDTRYMFGCSSIKTMDKDEIRHIYYFLQQQNHISLEHKVRPKGKFNVHGLHRHLKKNPRQLNLIDPADFKGKIPPLLQSYFRLGAKVCGRPAIDKSFRCIDFLTLLDVDQIKGQYLQKYHREETAKQG
jgi:putative hemolysin